MISTITAPAHTVTPAAPRESARRSLLAGGATIGTIHEAGTSFSKGQERRSRAMISPASRLSTAAPSSLRITRAYGQPSSMRQSCNPSGNVRREALGRAYQPDDYARGGDDGWQEVPNQRKIGWHAPRGGIA